MKNTTFVWLRRDLRLEDNVALSQALNLAADKVVVLFIFDKNILDDLEEKKDQRVVFIYQTLFQLKTTLRAKGKDLMVRYGDPLEIWKDLSRIFSISEMYFNRDYEPYAFSRDSRVREHLEGSGTKVYSFKDQVIFESDEVLKANGEPYVVFTPYKRQWLYRRQQIRREQPDLLLPNHNLEYDKFSDAQFEPIPSLAEMGFEDFKVDFPTDNIDLDLIKTYHKTRDFPAVKGTSHLGLHLRFGTISIRALLHTIGEINEVFLSELIWREFYSQILAHFPRVVSHSFRPKYDQIPWRNDPEEFEKWCLGKTGYPLVDAGMRELNSTGYMHNRVRMVTASFLTKHLLIDWRWGEAYFAKKLLDYDLASNNGGWQWAAGCGTDAAPYFRIFNPTTQQKKFDPQGTYVKRWLPELAELTYPDPIVDHRLARERCLRTYKAALS